MNSESVEIHHALGVGLALCRGDFFRMGGTGVGVGPEYGGGLVGGEREKLR